MTLPLFALGLALVLTNADPGPSSPASAAAPAAIEARGDRFTVWAREASLQLILERIGEIAQIKMHIEGLAEERITVEFQDVPLEDALRRLLHRRSAVLVFETIAGSLVAVRVVRPAALTDPPSLGDPEATEATSAGNHEGRRSDAAGEEPTDGGVLRVGDTVQLAYVDQARADLDPATTVWKEISGGLDTIELGKREVNSRQYVSWFNFRGGDQQKRVGDLSGGERNRVHLAKLLRSGGNVLLLDEPTNDLDVDTLRALEEALLEFAGCAVVITHDRWFLDRVATHILAFEGDSQTEWFEGSWGDYVEWVKETRGADALEPHRIKYKPLVRA